MINSMVGCTKTNQQLQKLPSSATSDQIDTLLNFLDEHRDLARGSKEAVGRIVKSAQFHGCYKSYLVFYYLINNIGISLYDFILTLLRLVAVHLWNPDSPNNNLKILSIMGDGFGERQTGASASL
ncbi:hypothetical protein HW555_002394, partial [Spodoptera exigua]